MVDKILDEFMIAHSSQVKFYDCKDICPLRFDCGVYTNDGKLMGLIEFNGEQHYHHITYFHPTRKEYIAARRRDRIKIDYCREKHIPLLILTY